MITPDEQKLLLLCHRDLQTALDHIESQNFGIAKSWIEQAMNRLPYDNGVHVAPWPDEIQLEAVRQP